MIQLFADGKKDGYSFPHWQKQTLFEILPRNEPKIVVHDEEAHCAIYTVSVLDKLRWTEFQSTDGYCGCAIANERSQIKIGNIMGLIKKKEHSWRVS